MKIHSIAISNCLSFAAQEPTLTPNVTFQTTGKNGSRHLLIGPNGAGKSNFIEIVNHCFRKALFRSAVLNENFLLAMQRGEYFLQDQLRQSLTMPNEQVNWALRYHDNSENELQKIKLSLELNDNDFDNLEFLLSNAEKINQILNQYSNSGVLVPRDALPNLKSHTSTNVTIEYRRNNNQLNITFQAEGDLTVNFIKTYLQNFQIFQMAIVLYNRYVRTDSDPPWPDLKQTFAMLGSYRNYAGINSSINIDSNRSFQPVYDRLKNESTKSGGGEEPAVFEMVKRKIGYAFYDLYENYSLADTLQRLYNEEPLVSINELLSKYLKLEIQIRKLNKIDPSMEMFFQRDRKRIDTSDLSSGEKGILHFIFTLYGFDLQNGVMVIDEPELHLHPQMQREYQAIIDDIQSKLDIQFIIATHSPVFVDANTIDQVYRFFKTDGHTEILNPVVTTPQKALVKILDLTNSSKIFFVNKVILVEGETDEYFFRFFLDYLSRNAQLPQAQPWQKQIADYEIVDIKGKQAREGWTDFLKKFGLQVSFIGDWDNINEVSNIDWKKFEQIYEATQKKATKEISKKGSADGRTLFKTIDEVIQTPSTENIKSLTEVKEYILRRVIDYSKVIEAIKNQTPDEWTALEAAIEEKYKEKVFILKQGEIEHYLGITEKGLSSIIDFCHNLFSSWLKDEVLKAHREELEKIIQLIFQPST